LLILIVAFDGWSSPNGLSIWSFIITTSDKKEYLYQLEDMSSERHTGEYLAERINNVIEKIGPRKFVAIVSDSGSNVNLARSMVKDKHKHLFNLKCINHCLNLISKDIIRHQFAERLIKKANIVTKFFKKSHIAHDRLNSLIEQKSIGGGYLKSYVTTRWTTVHEAAASIV
jgi:hypothetical protein